jgi:hypothetical protein
MIFLICPSIGSAGEGDNGTRRPVSRFPPRQMARESGFHPFDMGAPVGIITK